MNVPKRGEIWIVSLDPTEGSEIKKTRPCLVTSRSDFNQRSNTVTVIPLSSGFLMYPAWEVEIDKTSGLEAVSRLSLPQMRVAAKERLKNKIGEISSTKWREIEDKVMFYLGFDRGFFEPNEIVTFEL